MSDDTIVFERGDVFTTPDGPLKVVSAHGDLMVTDPTVSHPQDARACRWHVERESFAEDVRDPDSGVERARLEAETE